MACGAHAPRILSLDDYFLQETSKQEEDPETGKKVEVKVTYEQNTVLRLYVLIVTHMSHIVKINVCMICIFIIFKIYSTK